MKAILISLLSFIVVGIIVIAATNKPYTGYSDRIDALEKSKLNTDRVEHTNRISVLAK